MAERKKWKTICNDKVEEGVVLPEPVRQSHKLLIEGMLKHINEPVDPPKDLCEFETRLFKVLESGLEAIFGQQHYLSDQKYIKREPSIENLIHVTKELEKKAINGIKIINMPILEGFKFLKLALENDYPFSVRTQHYLGIFVDLSGISKLQKRSIGAQAAAQVFWYEKIKIGSGIEDMARELLTMESTSCLLDFDTTPPSFKVVCNWVGEVYPIPKNKRVKFEKPSKKLVNEYSKTLTLIPGVFSFKEPRSTNFPKLRIAIIVITKALSSLGLSKEEILQHHIFLTYMEPLRFYCRNLVENWVDEGLAFSGKIWAL